MIKIEIHNWVIGFCSCILLLQSCGERKRNDSRLKEERETNEVGVKVGKIKGDYLCISLAGLSKEVEKKASLGKPILPAIDTLFGLSWLEGYVIDKEKKDIILFGKRDKQRPSLYFEDIFINFKNVFDSIYPPLCSLDPQPKNTLAIQQILNDENLDFSTQLKLAKEAVGGQKVLVRGVPLNSRHGKVMVDADYDMKKITQGHLKVKDIRSTLEISEAEGENEKRSQTRFWFHIKENASGKAYPTFKEYKDILLINECPVVLLAKKQYSDEAGNLHDAQTGNNKNADIFANEMTKHFSNLAQSRKIFGDLENLYRLQACIRAMKFKNAIAIAGLDISGLLKLKLKLRRENELPDTYPGLVNGEIKRDTTKTNKGYSYRSRFQFVSGGVSQEMKIRNKNLQSERKLSKMKSSILEKRPSLDSFFWHVVISE